jgi:hypothetical protein
MIQPISTKHLDTGSRYAVCYRTGGTMAADWRRIYAPVSKVEAASYRESLERMGYKVVIHFWAEIAAHGLPIGWEANSPNYDLDTIEIKRDEAGVVYETKWRSHELLGAA